MGKLSKQLCKRALVEVLHNPYADLGLYRAGTGFLIDEMHFITCAHVISSALEIPSRMNPYDAPHKAVYLRFPFIENSYDISTSRAIDDTFLASEVVLWKPAWERRLGISNDIAILKLDNYKPANVCVPSLRVHSPYSIKGHNVAIFGIPSHYRGLSGLELAHGVVDSENETGPMEISLLGKSTTDLRCAGAPVWDMDLEEIIGMVAYYYGRGPVFLQNHELYEKALKDFYYTVSYPLGQEVDVYYNIKDLESDETISEDPAFDDDLGSGPEVPIEESLARLIEDNPHAKNQVRQNYPELWPRIESSLDIKRAAPLPKTTVLFLAADPTDQSRLRLDKEANKIEEQLEEDQLEDRFKIVKKGAIQPAIVSRAILKHKPQIVHFSGHGTSSGELCWEDECGETLEIKPEALARLFKLVSNQVNCVILNTCYSTRQGEAISKYIDYVIGSSGELDDDDAIAFSIGFYQALGANQTIEKAYEFGCAQEGLCRTDSTTPVLLKKRRFRR